MAELPKSGGAMETNQVAVLIVILIIGRIFGVFGK
jgi:hypothetical protein